VLVFGMQLDYGENGAILIPTLGLKPNKYMTMIGWNDISFLSIGVL